MTFYFIIRLHMYSNNVIGLDHVILLTRYHSAQQIIYITYYIFRTGLLPRYVSFPPGTPRGMPHLHVLMPYPSGRNRYLYVKWP